MLFMQLATAAYACPRLDVAGNGWTPPTAPASPMHEGCDKVDSAYPNLCQQHCQAGNQSFDSGVLLIPAPAPARTLEITLPDPAAVVDSRIALSRELLARCNSPPLTLRNCCFRI